VTIHADHPFATPEPERDPVRRLRGRLGGAVSLWTGADEDGRRAGLTVSSLMVAPGDPGRVLGLLDPDSDLLDTLRRTGTAVVQLLQWAHRDLADAFAGTAPAPGGPFRLASWEETAWGPLLAGATAWTGVRVDGTPAAVGWSALVSCRIEHVGLREEGPGAEPLVHRRGRYRRPD